MSGADIAARGLAARALAASAARARRVLHVGTRGGQLIGNQSNGTNLQLNSRTNHYVAVAATGLRLGWSNYWVNAGSAPNEMPGPVDFSKLTATINYVSPLTSPAPIRAFFAGTASTVLPTDATVISEAQGYHVVAGQRLQVSVHVETTSSTPFWRGRNAISGLGERSDEGATIADESMSGVPSGATGTFTFPPLLILGRPDNPATRSVALIGDSICEGGAGGETADATTGVLGYIEKGLGIAVANAKFSRGGDKLSAWIAGRYRRMAHIFQYFTDAFVELGTNDLYLDNRTALALQADYATLVGELRAAGLAVTVPTILPNTAGSAGWAAADGSDQTLHASTPQRLAFNAWLLGGGLPGVRVIDAAALVTLGTTGKWKPGLCGDGVHPNNAGAALLATAFPPSLFAAA